MDKSDAAWDSFIAHREERRTLVFKEVSATPVYIFVAFDSKGGYDGRSSAPPAGIPTSLYGKAAKGPAVAVKAGGPAVKVTFDDSQPWNK